jgi:hypothetical protein
MIKNYRLKVFGLVTTILFTYPSTSFADDSSNYQSASAAFVSVLNEAQELKISPSCDVPGLGQVANGLMFNHSSPPGPSMSSESFQKYMSSLSSAKSSFINQIRSVCTAAIKLVVETPQNNTPMIPIGSSIQAEAVKVAETPVPVETTTAVLDTATVTSETDAVSIEVSLSPTQQVDAYVIAKLAYWERRLHKLKYILE